MERIFLIASGSFTMEIKDEDEEFVYIPGAKINKEFVSKYNHSENNIAIFWSDPSEVKYKADSGNVIYTDNEKFKKAYLT